MRAIGYREYYPHQVTDMDQAREIKRMSIRPDGEPEDILSIRCDPSAWNKQSSSGMSTAEVFADEGLVMLKGDKDLNNGWRRLHQWLQPRENMDGDAILPALTFTRGCGNTIRTYPSCEQSVSNPDDINAKCEHHAQDVDRYFVMGRPDMSDTPGIVPSKHDEPIGGVSTFDGEEDQDDIEDAGVPMLGFYQ